MATVKPFRGIRPPKDLVQNVASRPYDVLSSDEARVEANGNPMSLYHIIKPEIDFPQGTPEDDPAVYRKALENFTLFKQNRWLIQDSSERFRSCSKRTRLPLWKNQKTRTHTPRKRRRQNATHTRH